MELNLTDYLKIVASTDIADMLCAIILSDKKRKGTLPEIKTLLEENRRLHENIDCRETRNLIFAFVDFIFILISKIYFTVITIA